MSDRNKSSIETKWDCEGFDECKDEAKLRIGKFNSFLTILGIAVGVYEFVMILFSEKAMGDTRNRSKHPLVQRMTGRDSFIFK